VRALSRWSDGHGCTVGKGKADGRANSRAGENADMLVRCGDDDDTSGMEVMR
jgi:hypothetical protein